LEKSGLIFPNLGKNRSPVFQSLEQFMPTSAPASQITLASRVTLLRILGVPVFVFLMVYYTLGLKRGLSLDSYRWMALGVFALVALTDALDGFLARSRHEITRLGRILDPIADKALLLSALIMLTRPSLTNLQPQFPIGFTILVISRDVMLLAGAFIVQHIAGQVEILPRWTGKVSTVLQMLAITWALAEGPLPQFSGLVWAAGFFTLVSGIQYIFDGIRQMDKAHGGPARAG
jgi:CDP-diacylglycerol--glycerol-3-phosphate 3-phosphatidyltransferase